MDDADGADQHRCQRKIRAIRVISVPTRLSLWTANFSKVLKL
jgi:hypothetical protein